MTTTGLLRQQNLVQNALTALKIPDIQRRFKFLLFALAVLRKKDK
jgi:hypothetical protein